MWRKTWQSGEIIILGCTEKVKLVTGKTGSLSPKVTCLTLSTSRKWPNQRQRLDFVFRIIILFQLQIFCTVSCWRNAIYIIHEAYFDDYHSANLIHKYFRYVVGFLFDFVWLLSFWAFFFKSEYKSMLVIKVWSFYSVETSLKFPLTTEVQ